MNRLRQILFVMLFLILPYSVNAQGNNAAMNNEKERREEKPRQTQSSQSQSSAPSTSSLVSSSSTVKAKSFKREDDFGSFHMITDVKISANGSIDAVTETNNHVHLVGNCGTVTVWLLDSDENVLYRMGGQQYCVDGKSIPFAGPSERKDAWNVSISPDDVKKVAGVSIMHGEGSKNFFDLVGEHLQKAKEVVQKCPECLALFAQ